MTTQTITQPFQGDFAADPVHSSFAFAVRHAGLSTFRGTLSDVDARLSAEGPVPTLEGAARVQSISVNEPAEFRAHILGPDFFDAENHPEVLFASSDVELGDDGAARVQGELTIRGVTRPVTATGTWAPPRQGLAGQVAALELEVTLDRRDYGIAWQMELPGGGEALAYEVTLSVHLELLAREG